MILPFSLKKDNIPLINSKSRSTRTPAILSCNLIRKGLEEFIRDHSETRLELFEYPVGVDPLYFSTLYVYFYAEHQKVIDQAKETKETNEPTQSNQPNQAKQPKPNTTSSSKKIQI